VRTSHPDHTNAAQPAAKNAVSTNCGSEASVKAAAQINIDLTMTITELLRAEHAAFSILLDEIETVLPSAATLGELRILVSVMAGFLQEHGQKEEELPYPALDQMQAQRGQMQDLTREHGEPDKQNRQVAKKKDLTKARREIGRLIQAVRQHFEHEERHLFPMAEECLQAANLVELRSAAGPKSPVSKRRAGLSKTAN